MGKTLCLIRRPTLEARPRPKGDSSIFSANTLVRLPETPHPRLRRKPGQSPLRGPRIGASLAGAVACWPMRGVAGLPDLLGSARADEAPAIAR